MAREHNLCNEERILIDPEDSKSQKLPEISNKDCAQIHSLTTQHTAKQGTHTTTNSEEHEQASLKIPTCNPSADSSNKEVGDSGFPFETYIEKGKEIWKKWIERVNGDSGLNKTPDKVPLDVEGYVALKGKAKETEIIRKGLGLLMTRMLFGTFVLCFCYFLSPINWAIHTLSSIHNAFLPIVTIFYMIAYCVATRYLHTKTNPSEPARVLISTVLWILTTIVISVWTIGVIADLTPMLYIMVLTAIISAISMVYMRQKYIDFSFFRCVVLNSVIIEIAYIITSTGSSFYSRSVELYITIPFVMFTVYIAYDMSAILQGKPQYSYLTLLASEWFPWNNTKSETTEDGTSINDPKEKCQNEKEEKVAIDGNDVNALLLARKEFIRRGYIILIYFLIATQFIVTFVASRRSYINGLIYYYKLYGNSWTEDAVSSLGILNVLSVTNLSVVIVVALYFSHKIRHVAPKLWLTVVGVSFIIVVSYVEDLMSELYIYEPKLFALAMLTIVCLFLMKYMRGRRIIIGLKPYLIPVYVLQAVMLLVYFMESHSNFVYCFYAVLLALIFSLYLIWDSSKVFQGTPDKSLILLLAGIDGTELPSDKNYEDEGENSIIK